jgi:L-2-hydroxyglutarate oxidase LhgO
VTTSGQGTVESVDCVVIGAGVVGLACARRLALDGHEVVVVERRGRIGEETSSRNSEVIHAGIYYPTDSLKAKLCVAGKARLYEYCRERALPHRRCGKIIVASEPAQEAALQGYAIQAERNGVRLEWLDAAQVNALEPAVRASAGLLSESTGIIDSHAYMVSLQGDLESAGGVVAFNTEVLDLGIERGLRVLTSTVTLECRRLVNAGGLWAPDLARRLDPSAPRAFYASGHYFTYSGPAPFERLVYPVAEPGGLGVHVTLDLAGQVKFGPDVTWLDGVDYTFDETRLAGFVESIRRYFPAVEPARLQPGYTGIRPKIAGPGEPNADFRIDGPETHGIGGLVNLLGIESPGLTASLAIADLVAERLSA